MAGKNGVITLMVVAKKQAGENLTDPFGDYRVIGGGDSSVTLHVSVDYRKYVWGCEINGLVRKGITCDLRDSRECPVVMFREAYEKWTRVGFESAPPFSIKNVLIPDDPCPMGLVSCV